MALIDRDPKFGTDRTTSALIDFGEGRHLTFTVSTQATAYQRVHILGTKARIEIEIPFNAPQGAAMRIYLDNGKKLANEDGQDDQVRQVRPVPASGAKRSRGPSAARRSRSSASTTPSCRCACSTRSSARKNRAAGKNPDPAIHVTT